MAVVKLEGETATLPGIGHYKRGEHQNRDQAASYARPWRKQTRADDKRYLLLVSKGRGRQQESAAAARQRNERRDGTLLRKEKRLACYRQPGKRNRGSCSSGCRRMRISGLYGCTMDMQADGAR